MGASLARAHLLFTVVREGPLRASTLADAVHVDPSTISRQVAQLVRLGLVERRADPHDGRASLLVATDVGRRLWGEWQRQRDRAFGSTVADWAPDDVRRLAELLARFNDSFAAHREAVTDALVGAGRDIDPTQERAR